MRRAVLVSLLAVSAASHPPKALAQRVERAPDVIDGAGSLNFHQRPRFKVGTWVKYRTGGTSLRGLSDDYTMTILVAGEEVWWGDPCVWIETWTQRKGQRIQYTASLLSYSAFGDTMAQKHLVWFVRKVVDGVLPNGRPDITLYARDRAEMKLRRVNYQDDPFPMRVDSLGPDTTTVPAGHFRVLKVRERQEQEETAEEGDSTTYYHRRLDRIIHYTDDVPLTQFAKMEIRDLQEGKTWRAGESEDRPLRTLERADGMTVLEGYGTSGLTPALVPAEYWKPIDRKLIEQALSMPSEPPVRVIQGSKGGS